MEKRPRAHSRGLEAESHPCRVVRALIFSLWSTNSSLLCRRWLETQGFRSATEDVDENPDGIEPGPDVHDLPRVLRQKFTDVVCVGRNVYM